MTKKFDYDYVKKYIENYNYKLISSEYLNIKSKINIMCSNEHMYETSFKNFKDGRRCPKCRKIPFNKVKELFENNGFTLLITEEQYSNTSTPIEVQCSNGHISKKRYDGLLEGKGCRDCGNESRRVKVEEVVGFIKEIGYIWENGEYKNSTSNLEIVCNKGHHFKSTLSNLKGGARCKECHHNSLRKDYEEVKGIISNRGYKLISTTYSNLRDKLLVECPKGHKYKVNLSSFKWGESDCSVCNANSISKGEAKISTVLENANVEYERQYTFEGCKDKRKLPFDFYIPSLNLAIEFDGEQHYKPKFNDNGYGFATTEYHDNIKDDYCKDNNIDLLRIPYWEYKNIEDVLTQHLILE